MVFDITGKGEILNFCFLAHNSVNVYRKDNTNFRTCPHVHFSWLEIGNKVTPLMGHSPSSGSRLWWLLLCNHPHMEFPGDISTPKFC